MLFAGIATFSFDKEAETLPVVTVVGGAQQAFSISAGINIQTAIDLTSVCPGKFHYFQMTAYQERRSVHEGGGKSRGT